MGKAAGPPTVVTVPTVALLRTLANSGPEDVLSTMTKDAPRCAAAPEPRVTEFTKLLWTTTTSDRLAGSTYASDYPTVSAETRVVSTE